MKNAPSAFHPQRKAPADRVGTPNRSAPNRSAPTRGSRIPGASGLGRRAPRGRRIAAAAAAAALAGAPFAATAAVPVIDAGVIRHQIIQIEKMGAELDNQVKQIERLQAQLDAITKPRAAGAIGSRYSDSVPGSWKAIYDSIDRAGADKALGGSSGAKSLAAALLKRREIVQSYLKDAQRAMGEIAAMQDAAAQTMDVKESQDLANRIAAEQARIENARNKLSAIESLFDAQERIEREGYKRSVKCMLQGGDFDACERPVGAEERRRR